MTGGIYRPWNQAVRWSVSNPSLLDFISPFQSFCPLLPYSVSFPSLAFLFLFIFILYYLQSFFFTFVNSLEVLLLHLFHQSYFFFPFFMFSPPPSPPSILLINSPSFLLPFLLLLILFPFFRLSFSPISLAHFRSTNPLQRHFLLTAIPRVPLV